MYNNNEEYNNAKRKLEEICSPSDIPLVSLASSLIYDIQSIMKIFADRNPSGVNASLTIGLVKCFIYALTGIDVNLESLIDYLENQMEEE